MSFRPALTALVMGALLSLSFAAQAETIDGKEAEAIWNSLPKSSETRDDGLVMRRNKQWDCVKSFDTERNRDRFQCSRNQ